MSAVNREYRDRLFKFIFGNPDNREWTLSLYNAVNNSDYTDPADIKFNTIEDAVYMSMKNDVSFIVEDAMNFYEQQSTFNPNMPMRFLAYAGMAYSRYIEVSGKYRRYSTVQQYAPVPRCICFYNGVSEKDDRAVLKLSDAFRGDTRADIDVRVTMININYGHNRELLERCRPLKEYSWFVNEVRVNRMSMDDLENAVDAALDKMPEDFVIKPFLMANKAEVRNMYITEYDEERTLNEQKEDGALEMLCSLVKDGLLDISRAAERVGMTVREFEAEIAARG